MSNWSLPLVCVLCLMLSCMSCNAPSRDSDVRAVEQPAEPPPAPREFRGVWVATVANIDWPSSPDLTAQQQQTEAMAILDRAKELNLNAVLLQVRPVADALYASQYEPWSYYLTGQQGKAPEPFYDPLQFWVDEAHKRGLELHAWFNPYRARQGAAKYASASNHVSKSNPKIVREFNGWQWLDPAEPGAQDQTFSVFMDVVQRYDVDGIHIDDYFFPYPDYLTNDGVTRDFPDDEPWQRYQQSGGKLSRADWRRASVDQLIRRIYEGTKATKRYVKFGISPFGIGRPEFMPPNIKGFNQFDKLYANAELWLQNGWLDYWTPQLYWKASSTSQPYKGLLDYWLSQNRTHRHVWPGLFTSRVGDEGTTRRATTRPGDAWTAKDIIEQIEITRHSPGAGGVVHFSMKVLMPRNFYEGKGATQPVNVPARSRGGIAEALKNGPYAQPALVPASTWLDNDPPTAPRVSISGGRVAWTPGAGERPWQYAVWTKRGNEWKFSVMPGSSTGMDLAGATAVCVSAVDRCGNESKRVTVTPKT
jgi:uncharacterized lipoprotein YddW (UPF0748 family)